MVKFFDRWKYLAAATIVAAAFFAYWPGFSGELIFDDRANLQPISSWLQGELAWNAVVFGNESGPLGRPLTMASFLLNAALFGDSVWWLKFGNFFFHLLTALAIFVLLTQLSSRDRILSKHPFWVPLLITAVWLLHPFLVGMVLYVVQRMAILSALFSVFALIVYFWGRQRLDHGKNLSGSLALFAAVPVLTAAAALSKETGLLIPALCAVIEWVYWRPSEGQRRPLAVRCFFGLFLIIPILFLLAVFFFFPEYFFGGYANRPFSLSDRLLTQPRVLFDYLKSLLLPSGPSFSILRDDYAISTGIFSPPITALAIAGWAALVALAIRLRDNIPGFTAGVGLFVVGHSMESTALPLLIYFEHRNYLPSIGIFLSVASLLLWCVSAAPQQLNRIVKLAPVIAITLLLSLSFASFSRAYVWQSSESLAAQTVESYPDSRHARMELARLELDKFFPDFENALEHAEHLTTLERPSSRSIGRIMTALTLCRQNAKVDPPVLKQIFSETPNILEADFFHSTDVLTNIAIEANCEGLSPPQIAAWLISISEKLDGPNASMLIWRVRFNASKLLAANGQLGQAFQQAALAWNQGKDPAVGLFAVDLLIKLDRFEEAERVLVAVLNEMPKSDNKGRSLAEGYDMLIRAGKLGFRSLDNF